MWITRSLNGRGWEHGIPVGLALAVILPLVFALGRELRMMEMGDEAAQALGVPIGRGPDLAAVERVARRSGVTGGEARLNQRPEGAWT